MPTKYSVVNKFLGYEHKPDQTNIAPGILVSGSQNVLMNEGERVQVRQGYTLDGQSNDTTAPIDSSFDWNRHVGDERNLRAYDNAGTVNLEYRYTDSDGEVTWRTLSTALASSDINFTVFWDTTELIERLLFVDGSSNIYDWSGGIATFASATVNTLTKEGTTTWAQEGFYTAGTRQVTIDGTVYTYTGGEGTTTLTGVTPDPTLGGYAAGEPIHQTIRTTANSTMTNIPSTFANSIIEVLYNQVYVGSFVNNTVYVSQQNSFTVYTQASPRTPGSGMIITLDAPPVGFVPQENFMYITAGKDYWYKIGLQLSSDNTKEAVIIDRLKTTAREAAQSQAMISKIKNSVVFVSNEPTFDTLGRVELVETPQARNISDIIKLDFDSYDFTGAHVLYFRYFIYIALPAEDRLLMYNQAVGYWEAPQIMPIKRLAIIGGELYGHSSQQPETYKLFDGESDNGSAINAIARFSYMNYGDRANAKALTEWYTEGYISINSTLNLTLYFDYKGASGIKEFEIEGTDTRIVLNVPDDGSLGKRSLGKRSLAGRGASEDERLPAKFRVLHAQAKTDFYEIQAEYSSDETAQRWELIAIGSDAQMSTAGNNDITI